MAMQLPERDKLSMSLEQMTSRFQDHDGGRVAGNWCSAATKVTSGASSDTSRRQTARMMATRWGLPEELGTVS